MDRCARGRARHLRAKREEPRSTGGPSTANRELESHVIILRSTDTDTQNTVELARVPTNCQSIILFSPGFAFQRGEGDFLPLSSLDSIVFSWLYNRQEKMSILQLSFSLLIVCCMLRKKKKEKKWDHTSVISDSQSVAKYTLV